MCPLRETNPADASEITTIFVSGFPDDVKARELHHLLRLQPGYEGGTIVRKAYRMGARVMGFAKFSSQADALGAISLLDGLDFDGQSRHVLQADLARRNMTFTGGGGVRFDSSSSSSSSLTREDEEGKAPPAKSAAGRDETVSPESVMASLPSPRVVMTPLIPTPLPKTDARREHHEENPPCNTLFIGALPNYLDEEALRKAIGAHPGSETIKYVPNGRGSSIAFLQFTDVESAIAAKEALTREANAGTGPSFRVQFAKSELNKYKRVHVEGIPVAQSALAVPFYHSYVPVPPYIPMGPMNPAANLAHMPLANTLSSFPSQ